ncbi:MAG: TAXI family TRAP transporter solute-binding subunit [Rhodobacteraceae bacterium]|nr:TAXI family TRAP transporter solute-binding subunit [Paracoccaceae bacterium]
MIRTIHTFRSRWGAAAAVAAAFATATPAMSNDIVIGANQPGSNFYVVGAALSDVISRNSNFTGRLMTSAGAGVWLPMMTTGEVDLGTASHYEAWLAARGEGPFPQPFNIGLIASGSGLNVALYVRNDSDIQTLADVRGRRIGSEYSGGPAIDVFKRGELANAGMTYDDMQALPRSTLYGGQREDFTEGRLDVFYASVGAGIVNELDSLVGVRFLGLDNSEEAVARMREIYPAVVTWVEPGAPGVREGMWMTFLPSYVVGFNDVSEEAVHTTLAALIDLNDDFRAANPALGGWTVDRFVTEDAIIPYHPHAVSFYKERGMWSDAMEARQQELLADFGRN